jgi:GNAT superfamily N-acetyltransferase
MMIQNINLKIRRIEIDDIPALVEYRIKYLAELQGEGSEKDNSGLKTQLENYFEKTLAENRFIGFLAQNEKEYLSFGAIIIREIPGDFKNPAYLEGDILNMYTVPHARKQGISSAILEKLVNEAKKRGISKVALHASKDGENMYRKFGFSEPQYPYFEMILNTNNFTH